MKTVAMVTLLSFLISASAIVGAPESSVATNASAYHGNSESRIFHQSACRYYNCKKCTVVFQTRQEAIDAGYRACKVCKP